MAAVWGMGSTATPVRIIGEQNNNINSMNRAYKDNNFKDMLICSICSIFQVIVRNGFRNSNLYRNCIDFTNRHQLQ